MIEETVRKKIEELVGRAAGLVKPGYVLELNERAQMAAWIAETLNVVALTISDATQPYRVAFAKAERSARPEQRVASMTELLKALLPDIDAGLLGNLNNQVRAATFDDFLDHAEFYRAGNRKMEAGVIAGVVFEDAVRRIHRDKLGDDRGIKLEELINALAKHNHITGQQSKQAKVASHVRTKATHAQWDEFDLAGVEATIQISRAFLREHLGG